MTAKIALAFILFCGGATAFAAADPTLHEVYEATNTGHLDQAQSMMVQVLRDHPRSAKAHFVAAEVYARAGRAAQARQELSAAQTLDPGLSFANPSSVSTLRAELAAPSYAVRPAAAPRAGFPLGWIVLLGVGLVVLWMIVRRRASPAAPMYGGPAYSGAPSGVPPSGPMMGGGYAPSGMGAGLGSSLATGLAVGAGVVAGEELAHHFLDGDRRTVAQPSDFEAPGTPPVNTDMGGNDFGVSDASSWGDGGGGDFGSGGGGDDWT